MAENSTGGAPPGELMLPGVDGHADLGDVLAGGAERTTRIRSTPFIARSCLVAARPDIAALTTQPRFVAALKSLQQKAGLSL